MGRPDSVRALTPKPKETRSLSGRGKRVNDVWRSLSLSGKAVMSRARKESVLKMVADGLVFRSNVFGKHELHFSRLIEGSKSNKAILCAGLTRIAQRNEFRSGNGS
jgi:hypothetical protein